MRRVERRRWGRRTPLENNMVGERGVGLFVRSSLAVFLV